MKFDVSNWLSKIMDDANTEGFDPETSTPSIPVPENTPLTNLHSLPPEEIMEWMARQQYKAWN